MKAGSRAAAVTGLGAVAPSGIGAERFWEALLRGEPALAPSPGSRLGAPVPPRAATLEGSGWALEEFADPRLLRRLSRFSAMSAVAAREALQHAGLLRTGPLKTGEAPDPLFEKAGAALGTAFGSSAYHFEYYEALFRRGLKEASPLLFSESVLNAASGHITHQLGLRGPGLTLVGGEDAGLAALAAALDLSRRGDVPFVLAGGAEEYCDILHAALAAQGTVGGEPCIPYARNGHPGFLGEGAALFILESAAAAAGRGAAALAWIAGAGSGRARAGEAPERAVERAVRSALSDAGIEAAEVDLVAGGAGGGPLDEAEVKGLAAVLDPRRSLWLAAPKRLAGEAFGFSSAAQALAAVLALSRGIVPPTPGEGETILPPAWKLTEEPVEAPLRGALAVSLTRARGATAIVVKK
ncbi:MAG: hypothetical protein HY717_06910 [Planctomycetes bacterium]|nr:hypothetical protein [Planctomycetota bacterium]